MDDNLAERSRYRGGTRRANVTQTETQGGKQPANRKVVRSGQQQSDSKDMTTLVGMKPGSAEAPQAASGRLSRVCNLVRSPARLQARTPARPVRRVREQQASLVSPPSTREAPRGDMTRAVPTMKPGDQPASTGAAPVRATVAGRRIKSFGATDQKGAVEAPPARAGQQPAQPSR